MEDMRDRHQIEAVLEARKHPPKPPYVPELTPEQKKLMRDQNMSALEAILATDCTEFGSVVRRRD
jgi:hypothetical protein